MSETSLQLRTLDEAIDLISDVKEIDNVTYRQIETGVHVELCAATTVHGILDLTSEEFASIQRYFSGILAFIETADS